jgi:hypothetical protein
MQVFEPGEAIPGPEYSLLPDESRAPLAIVVVAMAVVGLDCLMAVQIGRFPWIFEGLKWNPETTCFSSSKRTFCDYKRRRKSYAVMYRMGSRAKSGSGRHQTMAKIKA